MLSQVWTDAQNWHTGHWLNGRLESAPLDDLVSTLVQDMTGLTLDRPAIDALAEGYVIDRPLTARGVMDPLSAFFGFDTLICAGKVHFQQRNRGAIIDLSADDLVLDDEGAPFTLLRAQDSDLPHEVHLAFTSSEWDYRPASALSRRLEGATRRLAEGEVALVTHGAAAQHAADVWLQDLWVARERISFLLRPGFVDLEVGDVIRVPIAGTLRMFRVLRIAEQGARKVEARAIDLSIFDHRVQRSQEAALSAPVLPGVPHVEILDLALAREDVPVLQYVAAFADPWPGALSLYVRNGGGFVFFGSVTRCAIMGETLDAVSPGPVGRFDLATSFRVSLRGGAPASVSDDDLLAGRNMLALQGGDGRWELIGFGRADLVDAGVWNISRLLRGFGGEEDLAARLLPAGAKVVMVDEALVPLAQGLDRLGIKQSFRIGPHKRDYADATYLPFDAMASALSLKPYAPVRATGRRGPEGVHISFLRRTRRNGDNWEGLEVPLGEDSEAYVVDVLAGTQVKRSLSCNTPSVLYFAQQELADFGAAQSVLSLRIAQVSAAVGRGFDLTVTIPIS
jgi:hypothetical protein